MQKFLIIAGIALRNISGNISSVQEMKNETKLTKYALKEM